MEKICILLFLTVALSGATLNNKAETHTRVIEEPDSISVDLVKAKVQTLDSLLLQLNHKYHDKKH